MKINMDRRVSGGSIAATPTSISQDLRYGSNRFAALMSDSKASMMSPEVISEKENGGGTPVRARASAGKDGIGIKFGSAQKNNLIGNTNYGGGGSAQKQQQPSSQQQGTPLSCMKKKRRSILSDANNSGSVKRRNRRKSMGNRRVSFANHLTETHVFDKDAFVNARDSRGGSIMEAPSFQTPKGTTNGDEQHQDSENNLESAARSYPHQTPENWEARYESPGDSLVAAAAAADADVDADKGPTHRESLSPFAALVLDTMRSADKVASGGMPAASPDLRNENFDLTMDITANFTPGGGVVNDDAHADAAADDVTENITAAVPKLSELIEADQEDERENAQAEDGVHLTMDIETTADIQQQQQQQLQQLAANDTTFTMNLTQALREGAHPNWGPSEDDDDNDALGDESNKQNANTTENASDTVDVNAADNREEKKSGSSVSPSASVPADAAAAQHDDDFTMNYGAILSAGEHPTWGAKEATAEFDASATLAVHASADSLNDNDARGEEEQEHADNVTRVHDKVRSGRKSWAVMPGEEDTMGLDLTGKAKACMGDKTYGVVFGGAEPSPGYTQAISFHGPTPTATRSIGATSDVIVEEREEDGEVLLFDKDETDVLANDTLDSLSSGPSMRDGTPAAATPVSMLGDATQEAAVQPASDMPQAEALESGPEMEMEMTNVIDTDDAGIPLEDSEAGAANLRESMDITIADGLAETGDDAVDDMNDKSVADVSEEDGNDAVVNASEEAAITAEGNVDAAHVNVLTEEGGQVSVPEWSALGQQKLTFTDFCYEAGVSFLDHLRRNTSAAFFDLAPPPALETLEQSLHLMCITAPEVGMYETACRQLQEMVSAGKRHVMAAEEAFQETNPAISSRMQVSHGNDLAAIKSKIALVKKFCRLKTKQSWLAWRSRTERSHGGRLAEHLQLLNDDNIYLQNNLEMLRELGEIIRGAAQSAREKLEKARKVRAEKDAAIAERLSHQAQVSQANKKLEDSQERLARINRRVKDLERKRDEQRSRESRLNASIDSGRAEQASRASVSDDDEYDAVAGLQKRAKMAKSLLKKSDLLELQTAVSGVRFISEDTFAGLRTMAIGVGSIFVLSVALSPDSECEASIRLSQDAKVSLDESERALVCALYSGSMGTRVHPASADETLGTAKCACLTDVPRLVQEMSVKLHRIERMLKQLNTVRSRFPSLIGVEVTEAVGSSSSLHTLNLSFLNLGSETKVLVIVSLPPKSFAMEWGHVEVHVLAGSPVAEETIEHEISSLRGGYGWLWRMCACVDSMIRIK